MEVNILKVRVIFSNSTVELAFLLVRFHESHIKRYHFIQFNRVPPLNALHWQCQQVPVKVFYAYAFQQTEIYP